MPKPASPSFANAFHAGHVRLLLDSYRKLLGHPLLAWPGDNSSIAVQIFEAEFALVSHNTDPDPLFNYGNRTALALFEFSWDEFMCLPSRFSAAAVHQEERAALLAQVSIDGFIENYSGIRIAKSGRRFRIERAVVWNIYDAENRYRGQAACFRHWELLPAPSVRNGQA